MSQHGVDFKNLAIGATAFTIALAWNDAISSTIRTLYPQKTNRITIAYATVITLIAIVVYVAVTHTVRVATPFANKAGQLVKSYLPAARPL